MSRWLRQSCAVAALAVLAAGCATHEAPPAAPPPNAGIYKVGSPYQIGGTWYYPREQPDYDETGVASWYGPTFYGHPTANGETFDANSLTAAHRTLPLPVNVRVTNLDNGKSLVVRVNDRGPFAKGRIIDVSERAAKLLGFYDAGTARVRVVFVARADLPNGQAQPFGVDTAPSVETAVTAAPAGTVETGTLAPIPGTAQAPAAPVTALPQPQPAPVQTADLGALPNGEITQYQVLGVTHLYVQVGAFATYQNAQRLVEHLGGGLRISAIQRNGQTLYRVRSGPFDATTDADAELARLSNAGANDARIVVDE